jgi:hypothetical protein
MARFTGTGTCVSVSVAAPATHDAAGFAALTWTAIGEIESLDAIETKHASVDFANLCTGKTSRAKGAEEGIDFTLTVAMDRDDAGQALLTTARKSLTSIVSVKVLESSGDIAYLRAYVMGERMTGGAGVNDIRMNVYTFGVQAPATGDTVVVVNAV